MVFLNSGVLNYVTFLVFVLHLRLLWNPLFPAKKHFGRRLCIAFVLGLEKRGVREKEGLHNTTTSCAWDRAPGG